MADRGCSPSGLWPNRIEYPPDEKAKERFQVTREFQVIYRVMEAPNSTVPASLPQAINLIAEDAEEAKALLVNAHYEVLGVTEIRAVVDWDKPVWNLDEFAAAMGIRGGTLSAKKGDGTIPWSSKVNGVPHRVAMKWIEDSLNPAGKKVLEELQSEAA